MAPSYAVPGLFPFLCFLVFNAPNPLLSGRGARPDSWVHLDPDSADAPT